MLIKSTVIRGSKRATALLLASAFVVGGVFAAAAVNANVSQTDSVRITAEGEFGVNPDSVRITCIDGPVHECTGP